MNHKHKGMHPDIKIAVLRIVIGVILIAILAGLVICNFSDKSEPPQAQITRADSAVEVMVAPAQAPTPPAPEALQQSEPAAVLTEEAEMPSEQKAPYTIVWMSDTQLYSENYPSTFEDMTTWIVQNREALNLQYVIHTGDIVNRRDKPKQWENARNALSVLEGEIPLFTVAGNHDISSGKRIYDEYLPLFGEARLLALSPYNSGSFAGGIGRYDLLEINGDPVILLSVGYRPSSSELDWMNEVLAEHIDRTAILCFHGYLDTDGSFTTDGLKLSSEVVAKNPNVRLVLCGHRHGITHTTAEYDDNGDGSPDRTVYQLLADYQSEGKGGMGYMVLLSFNKESGELDVTAYSPLLDDYNLFDDSPGLETYSLKWR